jgi:hypothetical protein
VLTAAVTAVVLALAPPAGAVPWSVAYETATAGGHRWTERPAGAVFPDLVVAGSLTGQGSACHALWLRVTYDLFPSAPVKRAEICGAGTTPVSFRLPGYRPTTTAAVTLCRGTQNTQNCASWHSITTWPVRTPA